MQGILCPGLLRRLCRGPWDTVCQVLAGSGSRRAPDEAPHQKRHRQLSGNPWCPPLAHAVMKQKKIRQKPRAIYCNLPFIGLNIMNNKDHFEERGDGSY